MNYFDDPNGKHFSFESFADGCDETTFGVINFKGYEAISKPYDFEIMLVSSKKDLELEDLLQAQAVFTIHRGGDDDVLYNGILAEFDQLHEVNDVIFYRARLVPKLWWLTLTHHNQVFLDQSIPDIVEDALRDGGLETSDFDIGALSGYEENSYICQYDESHFNFVSRSLERQGIYYYFTQDSDGEVLTLTDTRFSHDALKEGADLFYNPASGLEGKHLGEAIGSFTCRQKQLPAEIILKDYNYERPSLDITSHADVDPGGRGVSYIYGEYFATTEEGERLANIRAEELLCKKQEFFGESTVPYIMPGFTFNLNNHYREDFNQEYLILEVTHEGNQSHLMSGGITTDSGKSHNQAIYHNSFKAIPNETQFRPDRVTEKPKISGTIHAKIDSEVDGEYAQIDEYGRYRVKLPFDINDEHLAGKGSALIRMMQSYAGKKRGMQFPLVKDTEVLLTFIEGNPDRPVIAGAVSNPETQGPVNADNLSESVIQSGGNNKIRMEDKKGSERIVLDSPAANSWIRVGAHNDPITLNGAATVYVKKGDPDWEDPGAVKHDSHATATWNMVGDDLVQDIAITQQDVIPTITNLAGTPFADDAAVLAKTGIYRYTYEDGNDTAIRTVVVHEPGEEIHSTVIPDAEGIRVRTAGDLWLEAQSRYGEYHIGKPVIAPKKATGSGNDVPNQIGDLLGKFGFDGTTARGYSPTGLLAFLKDDKDAEVPTNMNDAMSTAHIHVSSLDTFTTQEGNIYDFGGYWNYNLGNSYAENYMLQKDVELNKDNIDDLLNVGGPNWTSIDWPEMGNRTSNIGAMSGYTGNGLSVSETQLPGTYTNAGGEACMWVEKSFGNSYEYKEGASISVSKGHTLEVSHGGHTHVEVKYHKDRKAILYWSRSAGGITDEKKWVESGNLIYEGKTTNGFKNDGTFIRESERHFDRVTGDVCGYSSTQSTGMGKVSFEFDYSNVTSATVNSGMVLSTETYMGMKISNENYAGMKISNSNTAGADMEFKFAPLVLKIENSKVESNLPGGLRIKAEPTEMDTKVTNLKSEVNVLKNIVFEMHSSATKVNNQAVKASNTATVDSTM